MNASTFGTKEAITGVSAAVFTGQTPQREGTTSIGVEENLTAGPKNRERCRMKTRSRMGR